MAEPRRIDRPSFTIQELMDILGWQAGEVAHELNNLLTAICGYAELGILDTRTDKDACKYFDEILSITGRASELIHELLTHSQRKSMQSEPVNLNDIVCDMEKILRYILGEEIELITLTPLDLGKAKVVPGQVQQVLLNLALNARDAMPCGGRLVIQTANVAFGETCDERPPELEAGRYVMLTIGDNGSGIHEDTRDRIFEPFFTTKEAGLGTGLGLSTCNRIVKQSGGYITFDSQWGQGTDFKIYLPRIS